MMEYEVVIGLEVHAELATRSKIYCSCTTEFGGEPNTHCCPICTGMPGVLPVLNKKAVEYAVMAGLATNCEIAPFSKQDRKNYFYPDLPKAYQTSQYDLPLCANGYLEIEADGQTKKIRITRIHIEEDAGKLVHDEWGGDTLIDYNRCGVPLIEIVTEPDLRSAEEVKVFFEKLKAILEYTGVSDCKMQEGSLRADVNLSVRPKGQQAFGTRTEMKNLNSIRAIVRAVEGEAKRQIEELEYGGVIVQETRRWDDNKGESYSMRNKEEAHDYRYFPEPDLCPITVDEQWLNQIRASIPELPDARKKRYMEQYGLPAYDAAFITASKALAQFFENAVKSSDNPKAISNWIMGELSKKLNDSNLDPSQIPFPPEYLSGLVKLLDTNVISGKIAKQVFDLMWATGKNPEIIVEEQGLKVVTDTDAIRNVVLDVLRTNPQAVEDVKKGKTKSIGFLIGQIMKATKGKADPQAVNRILDEELGKL
jgi:aspartyl-tRNA(Asn)/glutamyl-tRNA(Gln) amidotransferase subunit B